MECLIMFDRISPAMGLVQVTGPCCMALYALWTKQAWWTVCLLWKTRTVWLEAGGAARDTSLDIGDERMSNTRTDGFGIVVIFCYFF